MQASWRIGSLFGIPLYIDSSWFLILVLVTLANATDINTQGLSGKLPFIGYLAGLLMALLLFASVLLHELGHSLVAKAQGIKVNSITLFLFGGIAAIDQESKTPFKALQVAIAGPLVSIILFALFLGCSLFFQETTLGYFLTIYLARINLIIAIFNLIPGLPLDGGQVLKALVWKFTGDRFTGVHWASVSGKLLGWLAIVGGIFLFVTAQQIGALWISLIGWFALRNADAYDRFNILQETLVNVTASEAMTRDFRVVNANLSLSDFAEEYILLNSQQMMPFYAASEGRYRGLIDVKDLQLIERSIWDTKNLIDIAHPLTEIASVQEKNNLAEVINKLENINANCITVLSAAGTVSGIIDRGDIVRIIATKHNLPIPETEIKRIKAEGTYPPGLPLAVIANSVNV